MLTYEEQMQEDYEALLGDIYLDDFYVCGKRDDCDE